MVTTEKAAAPTDAAIPTAATPPTTSSVTPTDLVVVQTKVRKTPVRRVTKPTTDAVLPPVLPVPPRKSVKAAPNSPEKSADAALVKAVAKAVAKVPTQAIAMAQPKAEKPAKKPKLVRDSFTIPKAEFSVLNDLKQRAEKLSSPAKKSELLRAGIKALAAMSDAAFLTALKLVPAIKTGRPTKG